MDALSVTNIPRNIKYLINIGLADMSVWLHDIRLLASLTKLNKIIS